MSDINWDNTADRMKQLTDVDVREFEFSDSEGEIEIGLFCEGEWVEGFPISIERAEELHRDLGKLLRKLQRQRERAYREAPCNHGEPRGWSGVCAKCGATL